MNVLEQRIMTDGIVKEGNVLKVDSFLNHQMDVALFDWMGQEFQRRFAGKKITKILTIEASGIGIACIVARYFQVPVVFAKKSKTSNLDADIYVTEVHSFTHNCTNQVIVSKKFINKDDHLLIIDDFLANGCALEGLIATAKAIPFGLQHIMTMFVSNIAPILIVAEACGLSDTDTASLTYSHN